MTNAAVAAILELREHIDLSGGDADAIAPITVLSHYDFVEVLEFNVRKTGAGKLGKRKQCNPGRSFPCGASCQSSKPTKSGNPRQCRKPLKGQAKNYQDWLKKVAKQDEREQAGRDKRKQQKAEASKLPKLEGSDKQVNWANEIRADFLSRIDNEIDRRSQRLDKLKTQDSKTLSERKKKRLNAYPAEIKDRQYIKRKISSLKSAKGLISGRNVETDYLIEMVKAFDRLTNDQLINDRDSYEVNVIGARQGRSPWHLVRELYVNESNLDFIEALDFASKKKKGGKKKNCTPGKSFGCGNSCQTLTNNCRKDLSQEASKAQKWLKMAAKQGDHLGESVVAWKVGKVVGGAIVAAAGVHGAPAIAAGIATESVIQAATATAIHYSKHRDSKPKETATYFARELAAGLAGKNAHTFAHLGVEALQASGLYEKLIPLVSGKVAGIGTAVSAAKTKKDQAVVERIVERSQADIGKVQDFFGRLTRLNFAEDEIGIDAIPSEEMEAVSMLVAEVMMAVAIELLGEP